MNRPFVETMAEIFPEEIWVDILFRLPVKSLMRFKCVSKGWRFKISDPGFAKSHLQRLKAGDLIPSRRIINRRFKRTPLQTIDFEALKGAIGGGDDCKPVELHCPNEDYSFWDNSIIVGSCDGLMCLLVPGRSCDGLMCLLVPGTLLIYNPATRERREFPGSDFVAKTPLFYGFGYDSRSHDYKLVEGGNGEAKIFSLKSGLWRSIQVQEESHLEVCGPGVYWNGAIRWFVDHSLPHRRQGVIMSFDLSKEKFHWELQVPEVDVDIDFVGIGIQGASLFIYSRGNDACIEAWIMDEHRIGGSWTKWFGVDCMHLLPVMRMAPIAYTRSGKIVLRVDSEQMNILDMEPRDMELIDIMDMEWNDMMDMMDMERMILINPEDRSWENYPIKGEVIEHAIYLETLVSSYLDIGPSII